MQTTKEIIRTRGCSIPKGPLSQAVKGGGLVFCSGGVPVDPVMDELIKGDIEIQTERVLQNLKAVLEAAGSSFDKVVKATVFLADKKDFAGMNRVFGQYFPKDPPARSTVQVELMIDAKVEIELIALA